MRPCSSLHQHISPQPDIVFVHVVLHFQQCTTKCTGIRKEEEKSKNDEVDWFSARAWEHSRSAGNYWISVLIKITWNELCLDATALPPNRTMSSTEWSSTIRERWAKETSSVFTDKFHSSDLFLVEFSFYSFAPIEMWAHIVFVLEFHFQCDWIERQECCDIMLSCGESKHPTITRPEMIPLRKHIIVLKMPKKNCFSFFFFLSFPFTHFSFFVRNNVVARERDAMAAHSQH